MDTSNIEDFDKTVGLIFGTLYQSFPIRKFIDGQIMQPLSRPSEEGFDDRYHHYAAIYRATMTWLIDAGYVWAELPRDKNESIFRDCVLSTKGLEILNMPTSLGPSIGSRLGDAMSDTAKDSFKDLAKEALTAGAVLAAGFGRSLFIP
jgi:hypothetical protein